MKRSAVRTFLAALALSHSAVADANPCVPPELLKWSSRIQQNYRDPAPTQVQIYFDASGSMAGYLAGANSTLRPIQDLLALFPAQAASRGDKVVFKKFGARMHEVAPNEIGQLADVKAYLCMRQQLGCDNQESHIDSVFNEITHSDRNSLSVIVSDLWLDNSELLASGPVALGLALSTLFRQGRSVDLLGISSPYRGRIFDLPAGGSYAGTTARPLFVIMVGPAEMVSTYRAALVTAGSAAFSPARVHESLFTPTPFQRPPPIGRTMEIVGRADGLKKDLILPPGFNWPLEQFSISRSELLRQQVRGAKTIQRADLNLRGVLRPNAVWTGPTVDMTKIWLLRNESALAGGACLGSEWIPFGGGRGAWSFRNPPKEILSFTVEPESTYAALPSGHTYLVFSTLTRTEVSVPNPADDWLREWSFSLSDQPKLLAHHPSFFPVLNLGTTASVLEAALKRGAPSELPVGAFAFAIRIDD